MPRHSPFRIQLTREERRELEARARKYTSPYRDVIRAKLVLLACAPQKFRQPSLRGRTRGGGPREWVALSPDTLATADALTR